MSKRETHRISKGLKLVKNKYGIWEARIPGPGTKEEKRVSLRTKELTTALDKVDEHGLVEAAEQAVRKREGNRIAKTLGFRDDVMKVGDAVRDWEVHLNERPLRLNTIRRMVGTVYTLSRHKDFANKRVTDVVPKDLDKYLNNRKSRISSIRSMASAIESFFQWCVDTGKCEINPMKTVSIRSDRMTQQQLLPRDYDPVSLRELETLCSHVERGGFEWCAFRLSWLTGMRLGDIAALQWASIRNGKIEIVTSKRGTLVSHEVTPEIQEVLDCLPERPKRMQSAKLSKGASFSVADRASKSDEYVWPIWARKYRIHPSTLSKHMSRLFTKAGVKNKSFHGIRRAYALRTHVAEAEHALADLERLRDELAKLMATNATAKKMGHKSIKTTTHYLRPAKKK